MFNKNQQKSQESWHRKRCAAVLIPTFGDLSVRAPIERRGETAACTHNGGPRLIGLSPAPIGSIGSIGGANPSYNPFCTSPSWGQPFAAGATRP